MKDLIAKLAYFFRSVNRPLLLVGVMFFLVVTSVLLTIFFVDSRGVEVAVKPSLFESRDFTHAPFGLMDAYEICVGEAESSLGDTLLRSTMLPLSTRYETKENSYMVVLDADVGTVHNWVNTMIFCSVNPAQRRVTYYKEHYEKRPSLLARSMNFLSKLMQ